MPEEIVQITSQRAYDDESTYQVEGERDPGITDEYNRHPVQEP
jgi:hypothetical protein